MFEENANICMSGGAEGADLQWGMCAGKAGHQVLHWTFRRHRTNAPVEECVCLTPEHLREADPFLLEANKTLKRRIPFDKPYVANLLRRDYYQVRWSHRVYAVSTFVRGGKIKGGTAWAVQMFLDRLPDGELYVFDQATDRWLAWREAWAEIDQPPLPTGIWAGIGSRDLKPNGKQAIRKLFGFEPEPILAMSP
jgi:hypothetical protein